MVAVVVWGLAKVLVELLFVAVLLLFCFGRYAFILSLGAVQAEEKWKCFGFTDTDL